MPRTLTAPRSTTTPQAPAVGMSPQWNWSQVRILVPASSTQRTCRVWTASACTGTKAIWWSSWFFSLFFFFFYFKDKKTHKGPHWEGNTSSNIWTPWKPCSVHLYWPWKKLQWHLITWLYLDFLLLQSLKGRALGFWQLKAALRWLMSYLITTLTSGLRTTSGSFATSVMAMIRM